MKTIWFFVVFPLFCFVTFSCAECLINIRLVSKDGEIFELSRSEYKHSKVLMTMVSDCIPSNETVPIPIAGDTMKFILEYMKHHANDEPESLPQASENLKLDQNPIRLVNVSQWDRDFASKVLYSVSDAHEQEEFAAVWIEVSEAADFFDMKLLLDLLMETLAVELEQKPFEELQEILGIDSAL